MSDHYDASVRRWLRAYPRRYLDVRGDELVDVISELAEPGATHVPLPIAADLVRGGVRVRLADRPPLVQRLAYRWFNRRLSAQWALWVRDDIGSPTYPLRRLAHIALVELAFFSSLRLATPETAPPGAALVGLFCAFVLIGYAGRNRVRRVARKRHGIDIHGCLAPRHATAMAWVRVQLAPRQAWPRLAIFGSLWAASAPAAAALMSRLPNERSFFGGSMTVEDATNAHALALPVLLCSVPVGLSFLAVVVWRVPRRLSERQVPPVPGVRVSGTSVAKTGAAAVAVGVAVLAAAALLVLPPPFEMFFVSGGVTCAPALVAAALVARRAERATSTIVSAGEIVRAACGRRQVAFRAQVWQLVASAPEPA